MTAKQLSDLLAKMTIRDLVWVAMERANRGGDEETAFQLFRLHARLTRLENKRR